MMPRLLFHVPALNEARTLGRVVRACVGHGERLVRDAGELSVLVIDDGSSDRTAEIAAELAAADPRVTFVTNKRTLGLGWAFRQALTHARAIDAGALINVDGDGQFDLTYLARLVMPILEGRCDIALGSRFIDRGLEPEMSWSHRQGNRALALVLSSLCGRRFHDVCCGFRAFSRRAIRALRLRSDFTYTHESILRGVELGLELVEIPVGVRGQREYGTSRLVPSKTYYGLRTSRIVWQTWVELRQQRGHEQLDPSTPELKVP